MKCPNCYEPDSDKVVNSRISADAEIILRRRVCESCNHRWSTAEIAIEIQMGQNNGTREALMRSAGSAEAVSRLIASLDKVIGDLQNIKEGALEGK